MPLDVTAVVSTTFVSTCLSHLNMYVRCTNCSRYIYILRIRIPIQHSHSTFAFVPCEPCFVSVIRICLFGQQLSTFVYPVKCICSCSTSLSSMLGLLVYLYLYLYLMCAPANDSLKCLTIFCHIKFHFE